MPTSGTKASFVNEKDDDKRNMNSLKTTFYSNDVLQNNVKNERKMLKETTLKCLRSRSKMI